jgi:hypothetical protein
LRALRVAAGKTQEDVGATKLMSLGKLKLIEHGRSMVRPGDVYELGTLYGADAQTIADLRALASATTQGGWWQESAGGLVKGFETYLDLESAAARLSIFQPAVVYGLLQTEAYAFAVDEVTADPDLGPAGIARNVRLRMRRLPTPLQRHNPPQIDMVLGEATLQLKVGDAEVMAAEHTGRRANPLGRSRCQGTGPRRRSLIARPRRQRTEPQGDRRCPDSVRCQTASGGRTRTASGYGRRPGADRDSVRGQPRPWTATSVGRRGPACGKEPAASGSGQRPRTDSGGGLSCKRLHDMFDVEAAQVGGFDQRGAVRVDASQGGGGRRPGLGRRPTTTPRGAARSSRAGPAYLRGLLSAECDSRTA